MLTPTVAVESAAIQSQANVFFVRDDIDMERVKALYLGRFAKVTPDF